MASVTLTIIDTPTGGVACHSDFQPAIGLPVTPAQAHALEIFNRTRKQWGLPANADANAERRALRQAMEATK